MKVPSGSSESSCCYCQVQPPSPSALAPGRAPVTQEASPTSRGGITTAPASADGAEHGVAYDFAFDAGPNGQQVKCLTVIDEFTLDCLAIDVAGSIRSHRVIEVLARLVSERGAPLHLRSDN